MDNYSLSDIKAATEGSNDGMFGGGSWAVVLIILFLIIMMGGSGWGNRVGDGGVATQGEVQRGIDSVNYNAAINTSNIIQAQERGTQKILDYLCGQENQRIRDENMRNYIASQFCGVVRYPTGFTYNAGASPFCGCGCGCGNNF